MMEQLSVEYCIQRMCHAFKVSRSGYYKYLTSGKNSNRSKENILLLLEIRNILLNNRMVYGSPRITVCLKRLGYNINRKRVARLMRENQIKARRRKKYHSTTNSEHNHKASPNLLMQNFMVGQLNRIWLTDITYIRTEEGFLYLAVVMDLCSRMVVGYNIQSHMRTSLVLDAFNKAYLKRGSPKELIIHSDQGIQFASDDFREILSNFGVTQSMSRKGNCYDNAPMESLFHSLKNELVYLVKFKTRKEAEYALKSYIDDFYVRIRLHSSLNYKSPKEFEDNFFVTK
jgi:transposase InsO family protein